MRSSIQIVIEEVKRLSNLYENRVPSALLFETLFKAEEIHKKEIFNAFSEGNAKIFCSNKEEYYRETFKKL